jgi:hypothetical protein
MCPLATPSYPNSNAFEMGRDGRYWPMAEATAAGRTVQLQRLNLPTASPFVNPDSATQGATARGLRRQIIPRAATALAASRCSPRDLAGLILGGTLA